jgi:hypothetical protein
LKVVHCKPFSSSSSTETAISAPGDLNDWPSILQQCEQGGCEWLAVENEAETLGDKFTVARNDLQSLKHSLSAML